MANILKKMSILRKKGDGLYEEISEISDSSACSSYVVLHECYANDGGTKKNAQRQSIMEQK